MDQNISPSRHHSLYVIRGSERENFIVVDIDTKRSTWFGTPLKKLSTYQRRKFENWVVLEHTGEHIKINYANY